MANNVQFESSVPATPSSATLVQTIQQPDTSQRQVVSVGDFWGSSVGNIPVIISSNITVTPSSNTTVVVFGTPTVTLSSAATVTPSSAVAVTAGSFIPIFEAITASSSISLTPVFSSAGENSHQFKASAGNLYAFECTNTSSLNGFVLLTDGSSVPADGAVLPERCYTMPSAATLMRGFDPPMAFATGINIMFSTTGPFTKTTPASSNTCFFAGEIV
jgi:hypothetical protein